MTKKKNQHTKSKKVAQELQDFANARKKPVIFFFPAESIQLGTVLQLREILADKHFPEIDFVIHSGGGDIHAAYQIVELLRMHSERFNACIPLYAKSAATLLCMGSDQIIIDELAQLGPLDTQILEEKKGGKKEYTSALNPFKTLEQLQKFSLETLDISVLMIARRSGMDLDVCIKHAIEFVQATTGPLFTKLDPEKLGAYSRALSIGKEYAERILRRYSNWNEEQRNLTLEKMVHSYPSHDFVIDYHELEELGFSVSLFEEKERPFVRGLFKLIGEARAILDLVLPSSGPQ